MNSSINDIAPNKISVVRDVLMTISTRLLEHENVFTRLGIVVFFGRAFPLLGLTRDKTLVTRALGKLRVLGEGTAPGDALIEAVKLLRKTSGVRKTIIITDGGFNEGVPLDIAALYASNSGVRVDIIVLNNLLGERDQRYIDYTVKICNGKAFIVTTKSELLNALYKSSMPK